MKKTYDGNNNAHFIIINDTAIGAQEKYSTYSSSQKNYNSGTAINRQYGCFSDWKNNISVALWVSSSNHNLNFRENA
ncbi:MAG: hypothetical protein V1859_00975 [archaeon]